MFTAEGRASCSVNKTKPQLSVYKKEEFRHLSHTKPHKASLFAELGVKRHLFLHLKGQICITLSCKIILSEAIN